MFVARRAPGGALSHFARFRPLEQHARRRYSQEASAAEVSLEKLEGPDKGIAVIVFNRPQAKNAIGKRFLSEFSDSLSAVQFDKSVRVVILRSAVPSVFCAGADLKERASMSQTEVAMFVSSLRSTFSRLGSLRVPTIAAINGAALGGGLEIALACDLRYAGTGTTLGLPETKLAIIPGAGGTQRLPRIVGIPRAKELIFTGRVLNPEQAAAIGLVNEAVNGDAYNRALEVAREILPKGPIALHMAKIAIDEGTGGSLDHGLKVEELCYAQVIPTKDRLEGLAAFKEKRTPNYIGE